MQIAATPPLHLTYCSNIHPGESWSETHHNLRHEATKVKALVCPEEPFGLGLRLSALAVEELLRSRDPMELRAELAELGLYVFTLNGFPYGAFHGVPVKQDVYRPDWREPARLAYTERLIDALAGLLPAGVGGSISTVPIGFRSELRTRGDVAASVANLLSAAASLWRIRERSGHDIALALEPEPACYLETTAEAVSFFEHELFCASACVDFARRTGLSTVRAEEALRTHLGVCLDTCHAAVEFEDARDAVGALRAAGVRLAKVQATTGLHVEPLDPARIEALGAFADPIYLHQVVAKRTELDGSVQLRRFVDLDEALAARERTPAESWRVHYHVPVFERELGPFTNTQPFLEAALRAVRAEGLCHQFEVETYTWSVLPERYRTRALSEMIADELRWVARALR